MVVVYDGSVLTTCTECRSCCDEVEAVAPGAVATDGDAAHSACVATKLRRSSLRRTADVPATADMSAPDLGIDRGRSTRTQPRTKSKQRWAASQRRWLRASRISKARPYPASASSSLPCCSCKSARLSTSSARCGWFGPRAPSSDFSFWRYSFALSSKPAAASIPSKLEHKTGFLLRGCSRRSMAFVAGVAMIWGSSKDCRRERERSKAVSDDSHHSQRVQQQCSPPSMAALTSTASRSCSNSKTAPRVCASLPESRRTFWVCSRAIQGFPLSSSCQPPSTQVARRGSTSEAAHTGEITQALRFSCLR